MTATTKTANFWRTALGASLLTIGAAACGGGSDNLPPPPPPPPPPAATVDAAPPETTTVTPAPEETAPPPKPPAPPVTLLPGAPSPNPPAPLPVVKITAPTHNQVIAVDKAADFGVKLDVKNWPTAVASTHVHLILDNKPYKAIYETKTPSKLSELAGGEPLAEGLHVLVAFASRANHESVKTREAMAITTFWIGKKGGAAADPTKKPMFIYSRPKGNYSGDRGNHVLVDFQLANVTLGEGKNHVKFTVLSGPGVEKDLSATVTKFGTPLYLDNLQNGSYTIKGELLDRSGKVIEGPWNSTTRTFNIDHDVPTDLGPPAPATPAQ